MSGPTLALGISAPGYKQVESLAAAVERLDASLAGLGRGGGNTINLGGLEALNAQMARISAGLTENMAGLRMDIGELRTGMVKALQEGFQAIAVATQAGGKKVESELDEANARISKSAAKVRLSMSKVDLGAGLTAATSGSGINSAEAVRKSQEALKGLPEALAAEKAKTDAATAALARSRALSGLTLGMATLKWTQQQASDAEKVRVSVEKAAAKKLEASEKSFQSALRAAKLEDWATQMRSTALGVSTMKWTQAQADAAEKIKLSTEKAAAKKLEASEKSFQASLVAAKLEDWAAQMRSTTLGMSTMRWTQAQAVSAAKDLESATLRSIKMGMSTLKVTQANDLASLLDRQASALRGAKLGMSTLKWTEQQAASAAKELESAAKHAAAIDLGARKVEAAYQASSNRARLRSVIRAVAELDRDVPIAAVAKGRGESALNEALYYKSIGVSIDYLKLKYDELGANAGRAGAAAVAAAARQAAALELAVRKADALYLVGDERVRARMGRNAASQLSTGISPTAVQGRYGSWALEAAQTQGLPALSAEYERLSQTKKKVSDEADKATPKLKGFSDQMNYAHSAARGLASGFGALWLTWGSLVPLMAGAAISYGFVQTIKAGAEVQNTFTQIRVLAGATVEDIAALNAQMSDLAVNSQYGPRELATAMKTLSLAGLTTKDVFSAVRDVLNFATAGDTSIAKAADVMTTVATAFSISADGYSYVGDTIAKAAAESKSSVESMGEAFKTSSVINQQYGVSLEDTAVGLSLLANAGIQGSAAGTSLRNMYADLAGRAPKVVTALKELGVNAIDPLTGKMREQAAVFRDLMEALSEKTPETQFNYIKTIFSERGEKEALAIITALRTKAKEIGSEAASFYDELLEKITNAAGFTAIAAAEMALTPLNQMKSVMSTLENSFVQTFNSMQPMVLDFATKLKEIFNSAEFKSSLESLMVLVGNLTLFVLDHGKQILTVVAAYVGFKAVVGILTTVAAATTAWGAATTASIGAVALASRAAMVANPLLSILVGLVTAGAVAWGMYQLWADKGVKSTEELGTNNVKELLARLEAEEDRLKKINHARRENISLMEQENNLALAKMKSEPSKEMSDARRALSEFDANSSNSLNLPRGQAEANSQLANLFKNRSQRFAAGTRPEEVDPRIAGRARLEQALAAATFQHGENVLAVQRAMAGVKGQGAEIAEAQRIAAKKRQEEILNGTGVKPEKNKLLQDASLSTVASSMSTQVSLIEDNYAKEIRLLDDKYRAQEVSSGAYYAGLIGHVKDFSKKESDAIKRSTGEYLVESEARDRAIKASPLKGREQTQALENNELALQKFVSEGDARFFKFQNTTQEKLSGAATDYARDTNKMIASSEQYWLRADQTMQKDIAVSQAKRDLAGATEEARAVGEAHAKVQASHTVVMENLGAELGRAQKSVEDFYATYDNRDIGAVEGSFIAVLEKRAAGLALSLETANARIEKLKSTAGADALNDLQNKKTDAARKDIEKMANNVTEKLADAILDGGKDGFKGLKDWVKNTLFREPLKIILQGVLQPVGNMVANFASSAMGLGGVGGVSGGGVGSIGNVAGSWLQNVGTSYASKSLNIGGAGGIADTAAGTFGYGSGLGGAAVTAAETAATVAATETALLAAGATVVEAGTAATALGVTGAATTGTFGAGLSAAVMAIPVWGWALAAIALIASFSGSSGGPKKDSFYGEGIDTRFGNSDPASVKPFVDTAQAQFDAIAKMHGGTPGSAKFGLRVSKDPDGDSPTFVQNGVTFNGKEVRSNWNRNVGRSDDELKAAVELQMKESLLFALQAADMKGSLGDYIRSLGDLAIAGADAINAAATRVTKASEERAGVQAKLDELTMSSVQKLTKHRDAERRAIDATNKELLEQLYAQENFASASNDLLTAYNSQMEAIAELTTYAKDLREFVRSAFLGDQSPLEASQKMAAAEQNFDATMAAARGGNTAAQGNLTGVAGDYLTALGNGAGSRLEYDIGFAKVTSSLLVEAARAGSAAAQDPLLDTAKAQLVELGLINTNVMTFTQAWVNFNSSKTALESARAASAVADAAYTPSTVTMSDPEPTPGTLAYYQKYGSLWPHTPSDNTIDTQSGASFANGGYHWGGLRMVGENGPELEATGASYIHDAATTRKIMSGGNSSESDGAVVQELRMMRAELQANVGFTFKMSKDIGELKLRGFPVKNTEDGLALVTKL